MTVITVEWDKGYAQVQTLGAMLGPASFVLPGGKTVEPLAVAPWGNDESAAHDALPGVLKRLRGEWPCVPFGAPEPPAGLPVGWRAPSGQPIDPFFHGYGSNHEWTVEDHTSSSVQLLICYPQHHPIARLRRVVRGIQGQARISCRLEITARSDVSTTLALHPVLALSDAAGQCKLEVGKFRFGHTFPVQLERNVSIAEPDRSFSSLGQVPARNGSISLESLPLAENTEEIVQLCGVQGPVRLINQEAGYCHALSYDCCLFPSLLLWLSNRGRRAYPWNGRFTAFGVEPVRAAFDLGTAIGAWNTNPIARHGIATSLQLRAGETVATEYSLSVHAV